MSAPGRDLLDFIVANIEDDAPRLVYADWLEENGHAARAEFVRVQLQRARLPAWDAAQVRLRLREQELLAQHGETWLKEMPAIKGAKWEGFRRGVVAEVSFANFEAMRLNAHACRAVAPVEAVTVHWPRRKEGKENVQPIAELRELTLTGRPYDEEIARLADSPQLATLRSLTVLGLEAADLTRLAASPHLKGLRELRLQSNGLGSAGVRALTQAATLANLEKLDLSGPGYYESYYDNPLIDVAGMEMLAAWPGLARVRSLTLSGSDVRPTGLRALLRSPHVAALKELSLRSGRLDGQTVGEFMGALPTLRLETLDLGANVLYDGGPKEVMLAPGANVLKDVGAEYVALAPCLSELKSLNIDRCEISQTGAHLLAKKATFLNGLRQLNASHNHFGPSGLTALLDRAPAALHTLQLRDNNLANDGAKLLAASPASNGLLELDLRQNDLGAAASQALGETPHLRSLLVLHLGDNPIKKKDAAALAASALGKRLAVLDLEATGSDFDDL